MINISVSFAITLDLKGRFNRFLPASNICRLSIAENDKFHCINEAGKTIEVPFYITQREFLLSARVRAISLAARKVERVLRFIVRKIIPLSRLGDSFL